MDANTKRRFAIFGAGAVVGTFLSILLFQYAAYVDGPRETKKVEVVLTTCDLQKGDVFRPECVEERFVAEQFVPPHTITSDQKGLYVGETLHVGLSPGDAVRTVDFEQGDRE